METTLNENLRLYEQGIQEIRKRQELQNQSTSAADAAVNANFDNQKQRQRSETPPPPPISTNLATSSTYVYKSHSFGKNYYPPAVTKPMPVEQPKFSFQIKKPVKVDKFGLIRLATPALQNSPTPSPPRTKRSSRSLSPRYHRRRSRSRSRGDSRRKRYSRSRSRSRSSRYRSSSRRSRNRSRHNRSSSSNSRSRSRSRSRTRSIPGFRGRGRGRGFGSRGKPRSYRRSPSPFVPRGTPSPDSRYRRSRSPRFNRRSPRDRRLSRSPNPRSSKFGNRTWQRPDFKPRVDSSPGSSKKSDGKWLHDKFEDKNDGPSIEEIDEIISKAQKERKQDIINRNKNILKKTSNW